MRPDAAGSSGPVDAAYLRLATVGDLTDPILVEQMLRPWLQERAALATHDATMAVLTAQQVVVDFGLASSADFPSPWALEQWLDIRLAQTAGLFIGATPPGAGAQLTPPPPPTSRAALLLSPWLARLAKLRPLPWLLGGAATTAVAAGLAAAALTVAVTSGVVRTAPRQPPISPASGGAQVLLPPPDQVPLGATAPRRASGSGGQARGPRASGGNPTAHPTPFQPVVIVMAPLGQAVVAPASPAPAPPSASFNQPPSPPVLPSPLPPTAAEVSPRTCMPGFAVSAIVARAPTLELAAAADAVCPLPHPRPASLPSPRQLEVVSQAHSLARSVPPAAHALARVRQGGSRPRAGPGPLSRRRRSPRDAGHAALPSSRAGGPAGRARSSW